MQKILLTQNKFAVVDNKNYDYLNQFKWSAMRSKNTWYAGRYVKKAKGKYSTQLMHRLILGLNIGDKTQTDHKNHNGLDNREDNLRRCNHKQNSRNRMPKKGTSKYKGVRISAKDRSTKKWRAYITVNKNQKHLGNFNSEIEAARAYDIAAKKYFGKFANCNF